MSVLRRPVEVAVSSGQFTSDRLGGWLRPETVVSIFEFGAVVAY